MNSYYHRHYQEYYQVTSDIDSSVFLEPFVERVPAGSTVLDIGCGSGRDLNWLKRKGLMPTGLDYSPGLADLARTSSGCRVIEADFFEYDFSGHAFDGILMIASLVHVPWQEFEPLLAHIIKGLKDPGCLYLSMKQGSGLRSDSRGRTFYLWEDHELRKIFSNLSLTLIDLTRNRAPWNPEETWMGYILMKL